MRNLKQEIDALIWRSNEVESDQERDEIYQEIALLEAEREDKLNELGNIFAETEGLIESQKRLLDMRKSKLARVERAIELLLHGDKLETAEHSFGYRKSTAVAISDTGLIPESYRRIIPEKWEPDKTAIGKALKAGERVPGCALEERMNLQIR